MADFPTPNFSVDLKGQVALVTGTSSGLGNRFARVLAAAGADVAVCARRKDRLDSLAEELRAAHGVKVAPIALDVTDADACIAAVEQAERELGPLDILVNNAGI